MSTVQLFSLCATLISLCGYKQTKNISSKFLSPNHSHIFAALIADVAKLADALDLGSSAARHVGSTPIIRTTKTKAPTPEGAFFINLNTKSHQGKDLL